MIRYLKLATCKRKQKTLFAMIATPPTTCQFLQFSAVFVHQTCSVDAAVCDTAGPDQHAVTLAAAEVAAAPHRAIVLAPGAAQLQSEPNARGKVRCAEVANECHLVGAAQQDLHAQVEANLPV